MPLCLILEKGPGYMLNIVKINIVKGKSSWCALLQMSGWAGAQNLHGESGKAVMYTGMIDCFKKTFQEEGIRAFFKVHHIGVATIRCIWSYVLLCLTASRRHSRKRASVPSAR